MNRENVIKAVEEAFDLVHSDFIGTDDFNETEWEQNRTDAIALLKEQEAVEPYSHLTDDSDLYFTCGKCGHVIWSESYKYCPICGLKIAWNGEGR